MTSNSLSKNGKYLLENSSEYNADKVKDFDLNKTEQFYNEWIKSKNGNRINNMTEVKAATEMKDGTEVNGGTENKTRTKVKGGTEIKTRTEIKGGTEIKDGTETKDGTEVKDRKEVNVGSRIKEEQIDVPHDNETDQCFSTSIASTIDKVIDRRIDLQIALLESYDKLRENYDKKESLSILHKFFAPKLNLLDKNKQVKKTTKDIQQHGSTTTSTGCQETFPRDAKNKGAEEKYGHSSDSSLYAIQSEKTTLCPPSIIAFDPMGNRLSLENTIPNVDGYSNSNNQGVYAQSNVEYTTDINICTFRKSNNNSHFSESQAHSRETYREDEARPYKYRKIDSSTYFQTENNNTNIGHHTGLVGVPHQSHYQLNPPINQLESTFNNSYRSQFSFDNSTGEPCERHPPFPRTQMVEPDTYISEPQNHLLGPATPYERVLAENAVLQIIGNCKRKSKECDGQSEIWKKKMEENIKKIVSN